MSLSHFARSLLVFLTCAGFLVTDALAQTITLSPDPLNLQTNTTGSMTVTYSVPAPAGGLVLSVSAVPNTSVGVPAQVIIPEGLTAIVFQVVATAVAGTEQVFVTSGATGDSATVVVTDPNAPEPSCSKKVTGDATRAARAYIKAIDTAERLCRKSGAECAAALQQANVALNALIQAHGVVVATCN